MEDERCVYVASGELQAQGVRSFLAAAGIRTAVRAEALRHTHGLTLDGLGQVRILVAESDEEKARELIASAEAGELRLADDTDVGPEPDR